MKNLYVIIGSFLFAGIILIFYFALKVGELDYIGARTYEIKAGFSSLSGVNVGSRVELRGVRIGTLKKKFLDVKTEKAVAALELNKDYLLYDDSYARVKSSGLIGDKYIEIIQGSGFTDEYLGQGDYISGKSALDLEEIISKFIGGINME